MFLLERTGRHTKNESLSKNDKERLAMKRDDMPLPLPKRVANPRIRDDQALHEFNSNSDKMHRSTSVDALHKHGLITADLSVHARIDSTGYIRLFYE